MKNRESNEKDILIAAVLALGLPTRQRTISSDLARLLTYDKNCPQQLVSGSKVIVIPTHDNLKEFGGLDSKSTDLRVADKTINNSAWIASSALHKLEALRTTISRKMKTSTFSTPWDKLFPKSEEQKFLSVVKEFKKEFLVQLDIFITYYDEMIEIWSKIAAQQWGDKWGEIVIEHSPDLLDIISRFKFIGVTKDLAIRSESIKNDEIVGYFFDDLVETVDKWRNVKNLEFSLSKINSLKRDITPKLERYLFLDKRVSPIKSMADIGFARALNTLKQNQSKHQLEGEELNVFTELLNVLGNSSALFGIKVSEDLLTSKVESVKETKIQKSTESKTVNLMEHFANQL